METDKRPFYLWIVVLLANIGTILAFYLTQISDSGNFLLSSLFQKDIFIWIGISLILTVFPMLISKLVSKWRNRFGYGIPVLLLLPLPYFTWDYFTCTREWCGLSDMFLFACFSLSAIIFILFFTIAKYSVKWNIKFVLSLIWIELILLVCSIVYFSLTSFN